METFSCTGCARCCRNLVDGGARALRADWAALAARGFYALPREGGLQVWPWERRRLLAAAARAAKPMAFRPALAAVADSGAGPRAVVLLWELDGNACPLVTDDDRCGVYGERPVVCRAYPLLLTGGAFAVSGLCPGAVVPAERADLPSAYGGSFAAAEAASAFPGYVSTWLAFLESAGRISWIRSLDPAEVAALVADGRADDALDLLEREGVATQADLERWCASKGVAYAAGAGSCADPRTTVK